MTTDMTYGDGQPKPAGTWDYYGACAPDNVGCREQFCGNGYGKTISMCSTFTLGVFQWVESKRGTKRGKAIIRFRGETRKPAEATLKAQTACRILNDPAVQDVIKQKRMSADMIRAYLWQLPEWMRDETDTENRELARKQPGRERA